MRFSLPKKWLFQRFSHMEAMQLPKATKTRMRFSRNRPSRELRTLLLEAGFSPKETQRKGVSVTYFKQSEAIEDFLTALSLDMVCSSINAPLLSRF